MAPSQEASRSTTACISAQPASADTRLTALSAPGTGLAPLPLAPRGQAGPQMLPFLHSHLPSELGPRLPAATAAAGGRGGKSCPRQLAAELPAASPLLPLLQGRPSPRRCHAPRAPSAVPRLRGGDSAGELQGEEHELCRNRYCYIGVCFTKSPTRCVRRKRALWAFRTNARY